jgi:hypothetical protein
MGQRTPADLGLREGEVTFSCIEGVTQMQRRLFGLLTRPAAPVAPLGRVRCAKILDQEIRGQEDRRVRELGADRMQSCAPLYCWGSIFLPKRFGFFGG